VGEIQSARFAQFYRRLASLKESYTPDLQDTLMPTVELFNPVGFDLARARGENAVGFTALVPAVAAQFSQVWITPVQGVMFVPQWIAALNITPSGLAQLGFAPTANNPLPAATPQFGHLDTRAFRDVPNASTGGANGATLVTTGAAGVTPAFKALLSSVDWRITNFGVVLTRPDTSLVILAPVANTSFTVSIIALERLFELQENA